MQQYIRTSDEGINILDYYLLDLAGRTNLIEDIHRWAKVITVDLESEPDASNAEKVEAIDMQATMTVEATLDNLYTPDGEEVWIDPQTQQMIIELIAHDLAERYNVEL